MARGLSETRVTIHSRQSASSSRTQRSGDCLSGKPESGTVSRFTLVHRGRVGPQDFRCHIQFAVFVSLPFPCMEKCHFLFVIRSFRVLSENVSWSPKPLPSLSPSRLLGLACVLQVPCTQASLWDEQLELRPVTGAPSRQDDRRVALCSLFPTECRCADEGRADLGTCVYVEDPPRYSLKESGS